MPSVDSTSTNSFVNILDETAEIGVLAFGAIKNAGGLNLISVKLTVRNVFSDTEQSTTSVILPGHTWNFESITASIASQSPPYQNVKIEVKSTVSGLHSDYSLRAKVG